MLRVILPLKREADGRGRTRPRAPPMDRSGLQSTRDDADPRPTDTEAHRR